MFEQDGKTVRDADDVPFRFQGGLVWARRRIRLRQVDRRARSCGLSNPIAARLSSTASMSARRGHLAARAATSDTDCVAGPLFIAQSAPYASADT